MQTQVGAATTNPRPAIDQNDPIITTSDQIDATAAQRAGALFSAIGSDGGTCTMTGFGSAGTIERSCERTANVTTFACQQELNVTVKQKDTYECDTHYYGYTNSQVVLITECEAISQSQQCAKSASSCIVIGLDGACWGYRHTYTCTNPAGDMTPARLISSNPVEITETTSESCPRPVNANKCEADAPVCKSGLETRIINGVPITRACWAWDKPVACQDAGEYSDCAVFAQDSSCQRIQSDCLAEDTNGSCVSWEDRYRCSGTPDTGGETCDALTVCAGGYCETVAPEPANKDFAKSATWLGVMEEMSHDSQTSLETQEIRVFNGQRATCRVGALSVLNCCNDSGWGNGILGQCTDDEYALMDRATAKATHYVGTYCSKKFFVCLQKKRVYCSFNSKLARVFIEQYHTITGATWGGAKNGTVCAGLTVAQMETVDMEQFDLSEAFGDFANSAVIPSAATIQQFLHSRVGNP